MSDPTNADQVRLRENLWFLADLVNDPLFEIPKDRRTDALLALIQAAALESVASSLIEVRDAIDRLGHETVRRGAAKGGSFVPEE